MKLFSSAQMAEINKVAEKSKDMLAPPTAVKTRSVNADLSEISKQVEEYFQNSEAILITTADELHDYVSELIQAGYAGIDTETTGLDRIHDTIVGSSLYYPGGVECYIPNRHLIPIFDQPYKNQLTYEQVAVEFQRIADSGVKLIFANADFDLAMIYKDYKVDFCDNCYYDVQIAWRCIKENELHNGLKELYNKYVLQGKGDPKKFTDFFSPKLFPYCKPEIAKLYAANDAKITYELFLWQLPYITQSHSKCQKADLGRIADLIWRVEFPLMAVCQHLHRTGMYIDKHTASVLVGRYKQKMDEESAKLAKLVDEVMDGAGPLPSSLRVKQPFRSGAEFNPDSITHVRYLLYTLMKLPTTSAKQSTDKDVLGEINLPVTNQILRVRSLGVLISTFVDKLPKATTPDGRIHAQFKQIGADTGRMSSASPNMQNIPSHATDIRHMFRATPGYVMLSSDYSQQEPRLTAFVSQDAKMIDAFKHDRDIYATIASLAFNVPYEQCLEFHPETHEYQPDGKARRGEAKTIVLGICYGRSVVTIAEQLFGKDNTLTSDEKVAKAQKVYDSVLNAFPQLRTLMINAQRCATTKGYVETVLGRRRHIPAMQLPEFEFKATKDYVNPDIDPLDISTLSQKSEIPDRIVAELTAEFKKYKYFGQSARRIKELHEQGIKVINNRPKITEASRKCVNSIIQGSAADTTKLAMLALETDPEWKAIGGRLLVPVHDELVAEVPADKWKEGGEILSRLMCEAASFLPFPMKCDVTTTYRWYGLEYPCPYTRPKSLENLSEDEIKWLQYMFVELENLLPVFKEPDGSKPIGDAAVGVNGRMTDELQTCIEQYKNRYSIVSDEEFIDHIFNNVDKGETK